MRGMRILVGLCGLSFGAVSCGGGGITSVDGTLTLATLTPAQTAQLCADLGAYSTRSISSADPCKISGVVIPPRMVAPAKMTTWSSTIGWRAVL